MTEPADLHKFLRYEPETGKLFWLPRDPAPTNWNQLHAHKEAMACDNGRGYLTGDILDKQYLTHRVIWALMTGRWPVQVDHINGIKSDNRWSNLREVTDAENKLNQRPPRNNTSGRVGVRIHKPSGRYRAQITKAKKVHHLGYFDTFEEAARARAAAEKHHGFHANHGVRFDAV